MKILLAVLCCVLLSMAMPYCYSQTASTPSATAGTHADTPVTLIQEDAAAGLELWQTTLGRLWIPRPGYYVIAHLQWEQKVEKVYKHPLVQVRPGDVVIDCGAHIGGFTRTALDAGARMVIAIEPESANILAFKRNMAVELKSGKVKLVEKGVWDKDGKLALHISTVGDSHSAVIAQNGKRDEMIELTTLDHLVDSLKLARVDFIKMDIEGAERNALRGCRQVVQRWRPRLAISSYHLKGDPAAISALIWEFCPDYLVDSKDRVKGAEGASLPKVLFFH